MAVSIGVIGAGQMGNTHVRTLRAAVPGADVVAVSDAINDSAQRLARESSVDTVYAGAHELINDPGVEAVVIASPPDTHEQFVLACIEAGKPVLCEKPLARTPQAAWRVLEAEVAFGRRLVQVGFMRRFDPGYVDLKARLEQGEIGVPLLRGVRNPDARGAGGCPDPMRRTRRHRGANALSGALRHRRPDLVDGGRAFRPIRMTWMAPGSARLGCRAFTSHRP